MKVSNCVHYWKLESPNGATSQGTCKYCGTERSFPNVPEYMREGADHWKRQGLATYQAKVRNDKLAKAGNSN